MIPELDETICRILILCNMYCLTISALLGSWQLSTVLKKLKSPNFD